jgi:hypothetical protein
MAPPAGVPTTKVTGLVGHNWATAMGEVMTLKKASKAGIKQLRLKDTKVLMGNVLFSSLR